MNSDAVMRGFLITLAAAAGTGALAVIGLWSLSESEMGCVR